MYQRPPFFIRGMTTLDATHRRRDPLPRLAEQHGVLAIVLKFLLLGEELTRLRLWKHRLKGCI
jgi:hypothetical protein